jgi:DnaA family protein
MQIPLDISLRESASLASFHPGENRQVVSDIRACVENRGERFIYLWGGPGTGRSHLLQAACRLGAEHRLAVAYLPLVQAGSFEPAIFSDLGSLDIVCLDDIQAIAGQPSWEQALFHLFNQLWDSGARLLVSADRAPARLPLGLPDLASRLGWGLCYQLQPLDDQEKMAAIIDSASRLGMTLPPDTARYILRHALRDMESLQQILKRLDQASLAAQRKLTVPFVRNLLG